MKLLIIRPAALGDTLMLGPSLYALRGLAESFLAGRRPGIDFMRPLVSQCLDFEGAGWHALFMDASEPRAKLPIAAVDRVVAFLNDPQGAVGRNLKHSFPRATIAVLPGYPGEGEALHVALYLARAMEKCGLPLKAEKAVEKAFKHPLFPPGNRHRIRTVFHPGSGGARKNHPPEFWMNLVRSFQEMIPRVKEAPMMLLGPAEETLLPFFSGAKEVDLVFSPDRGRLCLLLQESLLYVGQDSGVTHLAAMMGTPTLALFRNTPVDQWRPLGPRARVIARHAASPELIDEALTQAQDLLSEGAGFP